MATQTADILNQIPVVDPDGVPGVVPAEDWPKAKAQGFTQAVFATSPEGKLGILHPQDAAAAVKQGFKIGQPTPQFDAERYSIKIPGGGEMTAPPRINPSDGLLKAAGRTVMEGPLNVAHNVKEAALAPFHIVQEGARQAGNYVESTAKSLNPGDLADIPVTLPGGPGNEATPVQTAIPGNAIVSAEKNVVAPAAKAGASFLEGQYDPATLATMGALKYLPEGSAALRLLKSAAGAYYGGKMGVGAVNEGTKAVESAAQGDVPSAVEHGVSALMQGAMAAESGGDTARALRSAPGDVREAAGNAVEAARSAAPVVREAAKAISPAVPDAIGTRLPSFLRTPAMETARNERLAPKRASNLAAAAEMGGRPAKGVNTFEDVATPILDPLRTVMAENGRKPGDYSGREGYKLAQEDTADLRQRYDDAYRALLDPIRGDYAGEAAKKAGQDAVSKIIGDAELMDRLKGSNDAQKVLNIGQEIASARTVGDLDDARIALNRLSTKYMGKGEGQQYESPILQEALAGAADSIRSHLYDQMAQAYGGMSTPEQIGPNGETVPAESRGITEEQIRELQREHGAAIQLDHLMQQAGNRLSSVASEEAARPGMFTRLRGLGYRATMGSKEHAAAGLMEKLFPPSEVELFNTRMGRVAKGAKAGETNFPQPPITGEYVGPQSEGPMGGPPRRLAAPPPEAEVLLPEGPRRLPPGNPRALPPGQYEMVPSSLEPLNVPRQPQLQPNREIVPPSRRLGPIRLSDRRAPEPSNQIEAVGVPQTAEATALEQHARRKASLPQLLRRTPPPDEGAPPASAPPVEPPPAPPAPAAPPPAAAKPVAEQTPEERRLNFERRMVNEVSLSMFRDRLAKAKTPEEKADAQYAIDRELAAMRGEPLPTRPGSGLPGILKSKAAARPAEQESATSLPAVLKRGKGVVKLPKGKAAPELLTERAGSPPKAVLAEASGTDRVAELRAQVDAAKQEHGVEAARREITAGKELGAELAKRHGDNPAVKEAAKVLRDIYIDSQGNYHVGEHGFGGAHSKGPIAPWNKEAKKLFRSSSELFDTLHAVEATPPQPVTQRGRAQESVSPERGVEKKTAVPSPAEKSGEAEQVPTAPRSQESGGGQEQFVEPQKKDNMYAVGKAILGNSMTAGSADAPLSWPARGLDLHLKNGFWWMRNSNMPDAAWSRVTDPSFNRVIEQAFKNGDLRNPSEVPVAKQEKPAGTPRQRFENQPVPKDAQKLEADVPKTGKNFEGRYLSAALEPAKRAWDAALGDKKITVEYGKPATYSGRKRIDVRSQDADGNFAGGLQIEQHAYNSSDGYDVIAKGYATERVGGTPHSTEVSQVLATKLDLASAKALAQSRLQSGNPYDKGKSWYAGSKEFKDSEVRPHAGVREPQRPEGFQKDTLVVQVPGDGRFTIHNDPNAINRAMKATENFAVPKAEPIGRSMAVPRSPSQFDSERYIMSLEKEIADLGDQLQHAQNERYQPAAISHIEEQLKAARENLADARSMTPEQAGEVKPSVPPASSIPKIVAGAAIGLGALAGKLQGDDKKHLPPFLRKGIATVTGPAKDKAVLDALTRQPDLHPDTRRQLAALSAPEPSVQDGIKRLYQTASDEQRSHVVIDASTQTGYVVRARQIVQSFPISTGKYGIGTGKGQTPGGLMEIADIRGKGLPLGTVMKGGQPIYEGGKLRIAPTQSSPSDVEPLMTSRYVYIRGLDPENRHVLDSGVRMHGTNKEGNLGTPDSHGCIRIPNEVMARLADSVLQPGSKVLVIGKPPEPYRGATQVASSLSDSPTRTQ